MNRAKARQADRDKKIAAQSALAQSKLRTLHPIVYDSIPVAPLRLHGPLGHLRTWSKFADIGLAV